MIKKPKFKYIFGISLTKLCEIFECNIPLCNIEGWRVLSPLRDCVCFNPTIKDESEILIFGHDDTSKFESFYLISKNCNWSRIE